MSDLSFWWELLREGFLASIAASLTLPLVGALLFLRRSALLGVAVPQFSAAGLAFGLFLIPFFPEVQHELLEHGHPPMLYSFGFAASFAFISLIVFASLAARRNYLIQGIVAGGFALALAVTILLLNASPVGNQLSDTLLRGEVLLLDVHGMTAILVICTLVLIGLFANWRPLLLFSFDPEQAVALGFSKYKSEFWQVVLVGAAVGGGVVTVGPILVFSLLFLPPLIAREGRPGMAPFIIRTVIIGLTSVLMSWPLSIAGDLPFGPCVSLCCLGLGLIAWLNNLVRRQAL